ncbi:hypothetical protein CEW89_17910 [Celeribacter ethanolicus]|uniref:ParB-like N-terminal domain-containing protein n=1 Tax=Celeribacter ethanolicus TaxID=1758178 RepID=A0A291GGY6_9RHOB|nr:hypothetical protein CEW89_17910 [Celeribacter ethanolicus]
MQITEETKSEAIKRLRADSGISSPDDCTPTALPLSKLKVAPAVFQPREFFSERHVKALATAIKAQGGQPLEPLTVWYSGRDWYVIDGHHRLEAYMLFNSSLSPKDRAKRTFHTIPVWSPITSREMGQKF